MTKNDISYKIMYNTKTNCNPTQEVVTENASQARRKQNNIDH